MGKTLNKTNKTLWEKYMYWICDDQLRMPEKRFNQISSLINFLHNYSFTPPLARDKNRISDAMEMRVVFLDTIEDDIRFERDPQMFEVLASLAVRMETEYIGDPSNPEPWKCFEDILENLFECDVCMYNNLYDEYRIKDYLHEFSKGDVPLFKGRKITPKMEIWSQMQAYIHENYY